MTSRSTSRSPETGEEGYLLLWLVVVCFILLLGLGVAAPKVAKQLERDREVESEHRAQEYVRAIQLYYRRTNSFPTSVDQLMGGGAAGGGARLGGAAANVRYLRAKYKDPLTNDEFRLIHVGEAQTTVKGFFGEPLQGAPAGNLGSVAGMVSNLGGNSSTPTPGTAGTNGSALGGTPTAAAGTADNGSGTAGTSASTGTGGTSATSFQGSKGGIVGVGSNAKGHGQVEWNGSEDIAQWEFLYDPRVELLKAKVSLFGGTPAANGSGSLGSGFAPVSGTTGLGAAPSTGLGNGSGAGTSAAPAAPAP